MRQLCHLKSVLNYSLVNPSVVEDVDHSNSMTAETLNRSVEKLLRPKSSIFTVSAIASILPTALLTHYTYTLLCHAVTRQRLLELIEEELKTPFLPPYLVPFIKVNCCTQCDTLVG